MKNKMTAGLLAIFVGYFGVHKFYLGQSGIGVVYLLFCWTGIPALVGLVKGIMYLCQPNEEFKGHISDKIKAKYPPENQNDGWKF